MLLRLGHHAVMHDGKTKAVDFQAVIRHLQSEGYTQRQLADWCGVSHGRIGQLAINNAVEPRFTAGHALLSLLTPAAHLRLTGYNRRYADSKGNGTRPPLEAVK